MLEVELSMPLNKTITRYTKRLWLMKLFGFCVLLLLVTFPRREPTAGATDPPTITQLAAGTTVTRQISAAGEVFAVTMEHGKLLRLWIDKGDLVLMTVVYGPTGAKLLEHISRDLEVVAVALPADIAGIYKIELRPRESLNAPRPYELKVEPFVNVTANERKDSEARQLLANAELLLANWREADLRQAKAKFDHAAQAWESIADFSNASLATLKAGDVCFRLSEFKEALNRYKNAESFAKKASNTLLQGRALSLGAVVYSYLGDNDRAEKHAAGAFNLLHSAAKDENPLFRSAYGEALATMAEVKYAKGDLAKAFEQFIEARKYLDHDREALAKVHRFMGYIRGSLGNFWAVEAESLRARELSQAVNDKVGEGLALTLLGVLRAYTGRQHEAMELHKTALNTFRSIGDRHSEALALNGMGQVHEVLNDYQNAIINTVDALELNERIGALDSVAVTTFQLTRLYQSLENHEQALRYLERCLALSRAAKKVRNEANALSEIAIVYASQKRPEQARIRHEQAQKFYERIGDRHGQAIALNRYGTFLLTSDKKRALDIYNQSLALSEKIGDTALRIDTLYNIALAHQSLGDYDAALATTEHSIKILEDFRAVVGSPDLRALYFSGVRNHYDLCRDILMQLDERRPNQGFAGRAFLMSEKSRSRSLLDRIRESQARLREGAAADLLRRESELGDLIRALANYEMELTFAAKKDPTEREAVSRRLAQLRSDYQEIEVKLRAQNAKQMRLESFEITDVKQIQEVLRPGNELLLQYALGNQQSYLWAITSDSFHSYKLPPAKQIEDVANEVSELVVARQKFNRSKTGDYAANVETADKLHSEKVRVLSQMLLGPVADQLGNRRLVFATEGVLQRVPFEALPQPHSQTTGPIGLEEYLIQSNEIVTIPSMTTLLAIRAEKRTLSPGKVVAIIADPVSNRNDDRVSAPEQSPSIIRVSTSEPSVLRDGPSRLIYAAEEADAIVAVAPRGTTMLAKGFDASRETAMSPGISEYQIVHFATHGFLDDERPELSGILLTSLDQNGVKKNGLMALHDIYTLDLSAELTVLSACETALGKDIKGEGAVGFTHSFMSAGSKSVVASLWKVDDQATATLMSDFYHSMLQEGMPPLAALRAAKLKMMQDKRWQAPYYWAGFVFQGDYDSRITTESNSYFVIILVLLLIALASFVLIVSLRRRRRLSPSAQSLNQGT